ncbi:MAG TPA: DEAD/DEAH box helicase [Vicinamibacterales bacterium]|nr:DEAD/DEAH box helicase [Vicinamibacterales bacterium]
MSSHTTQPHPSRGRRRRRPGRGNASRSTSRLHPAPAPKPAPIVRPQAEYDPRPAAFETLGLEPSLIEGIRVRGFTATTPIQSAVIPFVMSGDDLIGCAETGTGKTAAFLLPILNRMLKARAAAPEERGFTRVLILAPTRELCVQIEDDVQGFTYHTDLTSIAVYGGVPMDAQERALKSGVDIVVATPGRLMDHMRNGAVAFDKLDTLVLDEADRMMDMGFWPDVRRIVGALPDSAARQTLLFSATMPEEVMRLADEVVCDAKFVQIGTAGGPAKSITHTIENVPAGQKTEWLAKFLRRADGPVLVFVRTKSGAERLARRLAAAGLKAAALHADRTQAQRTQAVEGFRSGRYRVLVATDVAARGLDIDGITHVVNYEVPSNRETYVHRVGRTGRADATGTALTLVAPEELRALQALQRSFGMELQG